MSELAHSMLTAQNDTDARESHADRYPDADDGGVQYAKP